MPKENHAGSQVQGGEIKADLRINGGGLAEISLENRNIRVELTNIGCAITAIYTPDRENRRKNIVAGFSDLQQYRVNRDYFGVIVGRYANRIAGGSFQLEGIRYALTANDGTNHLHGGGSGFSHKLWQVSGVTGGRQQGSACFTYYSPDGEEGYPGDLNVSVEYVLDRFDRLSIHYAASSNKTTPVNLTSHSYFNLTGFEQPGIGDHELMINADAYTEKGADNTPTGRICAVDNTALDFRRAKKIGEGIGAFPVDRGYDHNLILRQAPGDLLQPAAVLREPSEGRMVTVYTDRPGIQLYTANYWDGSVTGRQGYPYVQHGGIALETQAFPDSLHHPHFPDTLLRPGETFKSTTVLAFGLTQSNEDDFL